jgi:hypothetical protein
MASIELLFDHHSLQSLKVFTSRRFGPTDDDFFDVFGDGPNKVLIHLQMSNER